MTDQYYIHISLTWCLYSLYVIQRLACITTISKLIIHLIQLIRAGTNVCFLAVFVWEETGII